MPPIEAPRSPCSRTRIGLTPLDPTEADETIRGIRELDVNPFLAAPDRESAYALDARIRLGSRHVGW